METSGELVQQLRSSFESKNPGLLLQVLTQATGPEGQPVLEELEIQIENLKNEAIKQFDQEFYQESLNSFQFLCQLHPHDHTLKEYRVLCEQMLGQSESSRSKERLADALKVFEEVNQDLENTSRTSETGPASFQEHAPTRTIPPGFPDEYSLDETPTDASQDAFIEVETLQDETSATTGHLLVRPQAEEKRRRIPVLSSRLLKRCLRVSILVLVIISFGILLSLITRRVRAPQTSEPPDVETVSEQTNDRNGEVDKQVDRESRAAEEKPTGPINTTDQKHSVSNSTQDSTQQTEAYPVIHKHILGDCKGEIRISGEFVSFVPFENSGDGFKRQAADILGIELDNTLKIRFSDRLYRFKPGSAGGRRTSRARLKELYQQLIELRRETR